VGPTSSARARCADSSSPATGPRPLAPGPLPHEGDDGRIEVYLDGDHRRTLTGPNLDGATRATFDFGIYDAFLSECDCEEMPTQVAYFDEVRRARTRAAVDPNRPAESTAATPTTAPPTPSSTTTADP